MIVAGADAVLVPIALVAEARQVWSTPGTNDVIVNGLVVAVAERVAPAGVTHTTRYDATGDPPSDTGGWITTDAPVELACTIAIEVIVGANGTVRTNVAGVDGTEPGPVPAALTACTTHVYDAPPVNDDTTIGDDVPVTRRATPVGELHTATNPVTSDPPATGGVNATVNRPAPDSTAVTAVGAPTTTNAFDTTDAVLVPNAFVADTRHRYSTPGTTPVTTNGDPEPDDETAPASAAVVHTAR